MGSWGTAEASGVLINYCYVTMSCEHKQHDPDEGPEHSTFEKIKAHAKEFIEATPEEHKKWLKNTFSKVNIIIMLNLIAYYAVYRALLKAKLLLFSLKKKKLTPAGLPSPLSPHSFSESFR